MALTELIKEKHKGKNNFLFTFLGRGTKAHAQTQHQGTMSLIHTLNKNQNRLQQEHRARVASTTVKDEAKKN